jgi:hypothetical protein
MQIGISTTKSLLTGVVHVGTSMQYSLEERKLYQKIEYYVEEIARILEEENAPKEQTNPKV